jgi:hypothetical protein
MKNFFSLESIKDVQIILWLFLIIIILGFILTRNLDLNYFNFYALIISISVYALCCLIDGIKYFNIGSLVVNILFGYGVFWFIFEVLNK